MKTQSSPSRLVVLRVLIAIAACWLTCAAHAASGPFALQFDGVDDAVMVPHASVFNSGDLTVTAWIKTTQTNGSAAIIAKYDDAIPNGWRLFLLDGSVRARYSLASNRFVGGASGLNGGRVADGQWHHIAFAVDASGGRLHVDGALRAAQGWAGTPGAATTTREMFLGVGPGLGAYAGLLDEVTVWSRTLTGTEIAATRMSSFVGVESGLRACFHLAEGAGVSTANSASGGLGLDGELLNGPVWALGLVLGPGVSTLPPDAVTSRSARLNGLASPGGTNTSAWFEWGVTTNYGNTTPTQPVGTGENAVEFGQFVTGLVSAVTVHFRGVASNALGLAYGSNVTVVPLVSSMTQERRGHTATLLPNGKVLVAGGYGVTVNFLGFPTNSAELFDPATGVWMPTGRMTTSHGLHTATLLLNGKVLVVDALGAELYDPTPGIWTRTGSPIAAHNVHTATLLPSGKVLVAGGIGNNPEIYDPATGQWTLTGPLNTARHQHTATLLRNGQVLVAGGEDNNGNVLASAELYDPVTGQWTFTGAMQTARTVHTATLQLNGQVLTVGGSDQNDYLASAERYDPIAGTWTPLSGMLTTRRGYHTATLLPSGAIVVASGYPVVPATAEILDPLGDQWRSARLPSVTRYSHTATLLPGGQILLAGGFDRTGIPIASAEVYDPHLPSWTATTAMAEGRYAHTATLLPDGRVLAAGHGHAELYSPASQTWSNAPALHTPRGYHSATLLNGGKVLVAGGLTAGFGATASAELFDFNTGLWTETGSLATNRYGHTATLLANGQVLAVGGVTEFFGQPIAVAELYNPATGQWTNTAPLSAPRSGHTATWLPNGKVLVAGGGPDSFTVTPSAELYDPATGQWTATGSMTTNRVGHRATLLPNGTVLVAGGVHGAFQLAGASAEIFDPATGVWTPTGSMKAGRQSAAATLLPGGRVLVAGGNGQGYLNTAELYDPATRAWTPVDIMSAATHQHTLTVLTNGKVLVTGGWTGNGGTNRADLFNADLGANLLWQPSSPVATRPSRRVILSC